MNLPDDIRVVEVLQDAHFSEGSTGPAWHRVGRVDRLDRDYVARANAGGLVDHTEAAWSQIRKERKWKAFKNDSNTRTESKFLGTHPDLSAPIPRTCPSFPTSLDRAENRLRKRKKPRTEKEIHSTLATCERNQLMNDSGTFNTKIKGLSSFHSWWAKHTEKVGQGY